MDAYVPEGSPIAPWSLTDGIADHTPPQRLEMDDTLARLKVIHVAGTKGKVIINRITVVCSMLPSAERWQGSTCTMVESVLRKCGHSTGLYTSPHLCDVRERIRINGYANGDVPLHHRS